MRHLLYIGQTPAEGTGSPVIVLRHLERFTADCWKIFIIAESGQDTTACQRAGWTLLTLPLRRAWWPPFRPRFGLSRTLRTWLLARECRRLTGDRPPDAVFSYLAAHDDFYPEIAARYSRLTRVPLSLLVHDDAAAFVTGHSEQRRLHHRHTWLLHQAHRCWFVSPELAAVHRLTGATSGVLPPIPSASAASAQWQPTFANRAVVYYAGFLWPAQLPLLAALARTLTAAGASLVVLTRATPALTNFFRTENITHVPSFPTNAEALAHLAQHAAGVLVSYAETVAAMPWTATSFPSKLIEYAQLGLPCAIVAAPDTAVGRWAHRNHFPDCFAPNDSARLSAWAQDLRTSAGWETHAAPVRALAAGEFNPATIHATLAGGLTHH